MNFSFGRKVFAASMLALAAVIPAEAGVLSNLESKLNILLKSNNSVEQKAAPAAIPAAASVQSQRESASTAMEKSQKEKSVKSSSSCRLGQKLLWYFPDRCMDFLDCFTFEFGFGANIRANLLLTRWVPVGAGAGPAVMIGWNGSREGGIYMLKGTNADFLNFRTANQDQSWIMGNYSELTDNGKAAPLYVQQYKDPLSFGFEGGFIGNAKAMVHLSSIADFIAGIFLIDFQNDDVVNQK